jgi:hypothetical protein
MADSTVAGVKSMLLTGNQDVRIDMTNMLNQITGLDLNGDGVIANNGMENSATVKAASGYVAVDAYTRLVNGVVNETDLSKVFLGDIKYDGTGFAGDGVKTNGNIVLGGLGADTILGGIGNDFLAAGGVAQSRGAVTESLSGGRNADFLFAELSLLSSTDGNKLFIDGGATADDTSAANGQSAQDSDWLLLQASDDDERIEVVLGEHAGTVGTNPINDGTLVTRAGQYATLRDIENVDASGNMYGFLKNLSTTVGGAPTGATNPNNNGIGSSGQLNITGSEAANIIIGGYDNDAINGGAGNDIIMGGNLNILINPNSVGIITDGMDNLQGGAGSDQIAFEADKGVINGGDDNDTLWLTAKSLGTGTAATVLAADQRVRFDLAVNTAIASAAGYGGADRASQDQTKYAATTGIQTGAVTVSNMENVIATGLGAIDFAAAGTNNPELVFDNIQNFMGYAGDMDLRGTNGADQTTLITAANPGSITWTFTTTGGVDTVPFTFADAATSAAQARAFVTTTYPAIAATLTAAAPASSAIVAATAAVNSIATYVGGENTLYANAGNDVLEGRGGNDKLSGGDGNDDFVFFLQNAAGDGVDVIHRQADANGDNLWDGYNSITNSGGTFVQDFGQVSAAITANSKLTLTLTDTTNPTDLTGFPVNGVAFKLDGVSYTVPLTSGVQGTYAAFTAGLNAALDANPALAALNAVLNANNTITITDPAGKTFVSIGYTFVGNVVPPAGTLTWNQNVGGPDVSQTMDRLIYNSYADRADNELVHDDAVVGTIISLGRDAYAQDLVVNFAADGTRLAEDQAYVLKFTNLTTRDKVTVAVNGVTYQLQVGVNLDGVAINAEDATAAGTSAISIQSAFLARLTAFIDSFMDANSAAGQVDAALSSSSPTSGTDTIRLTQVAYNGEETVFMTTPVVTLQNLSNGEAPSVTVTNGASHEVLLLNFDGRNNNLNTTDVLFLGDTGVNRSTFETAKSAGQVLAGKEAVLVDGGTDDLAGIAVNTANNQPLNAANVNYSVHGDDFLLGGDGNDTITGGTGDDRVQGSKGTDTLDGGKNYYAVKVLGEAEARVLVWNEWEAANPTSAQSRLADPTLAGTILSSVTLITQSESGIAPSSSAATANATAPGLFDDTLIYAQSDFTTGSTKFTVTLNNYLYNAGTGLVSLNNGGAGTVTVDMTGDGATADDKTSAFTNFENVRTVSGTGLAVANAGQGNDTLNVASLSTDTGGIVYNLSSATVASIQVGQVRYSADAHANALRPTTDGTPVTGEFESPVIKVDGVETVIAGNGDDLLLIDHNEAAKNNTFTGSLGDDRIEYGQTFVLEAGSTQFLAAPTVTIKLDNVAALNTATTGTDTVTLTGGRVGTTVAVDTLNAVEVITIGGSMAQSIKEADVLDVTSMTAGAIVNYNDALQNTALGVANVGTVRALDGTLHVSVENMYQVENVWADGNDTVILADAAVMRLNGTEDTILAEAAKDISFATFMDYDTLQVPGTNNARLLFAAQSAVQIENVLNEGEFKFNLSKTGTGADTDTVDYSEASDNIAVVVELDATKTTQYVLVDADGTTFGTTGDMGAAGDRIDSLTSVERIVAAKSTNESILDLTSSTKGLEIRYSAPVAADRVATSAVTKINAYDATGVKISDITSSTPISRTYMEYVDASDVADVVGNTSKSATWNRIEGSDNAERVIVASSHSLTKDTYNLRGGANEVKYNELTKSITLTLSVTDFVPGNALATGIISGSVNFQDGTGAAVEGAYINTVTDPTSGTFNGDLITSYTENNGIANGSLRVAASQDAEDTLKLSGLTDKLFLLSEIGTTDNQITVKLGSGTAANSIILTGFELLSDAGSNDLYNMGSLATVAAGLKFTDTAGDHDTLKVADDAAGNGGTINLATQNTTFSMDFDVLDMTSELSTGLILTGVVGGEGTDEVVVGALSQIASVTNFESMVMTTVTGGSTFTLNTTLNTLVQGSTTVTADAQLRTLSVGGLALEGELGNSYLTPLATGVTMTAVGAAGVTFIGGSGSDTLNGVNGNDTLIGGAGADTLNGGFTPIQAPVISYSLNGGAAILTADGNRINILGVTVEAETLAPAVGGLVVAGAVPVVVGADSDTVGSAFAGVSLANWKTALTAGLVVGAPAASQNSLTAGEIAALQSVTYNAADNRLIFTFAASTASAGIAAADFGAAAPTGGTITAAVGNALDLPYAARVDSADTYIIGDSDSGNTEAAADTISAWDVSDTLVMGYGGHATNYSEAVAVVASFAAAQTAAATAIALLNTNDGVGGTEPEFYNFQWTATNGYLFEDTNGDGTIDQFVIMTAADNTMISSANFVGQLNGTQAADTLTGFAGNDVINGYGGVDTINGGLGADTITGGAGADIINVGVDTAADVVVFTASNEGADVVTNFVTADDTVRITGSLAALVDDITVNGTFAWGDSGGVGAANVVVNLTTTVEALNIQGADNALTPAQTLLAANVATAINAAFAITAVAGNDALVFINSFTAGSSQALWLYVEDGVTPEAQASELTLIGSFSAAAGGWTQGDLLLG